MTAQRGRDLLLKLDDGSGAFVTVAGLRTHADGLPGYLDVASRLLAAAFGESAPSRP